MEILEGARTFIDSFDSFVLTTHTGPDADGIASELVLSRLLTHLGKRSRIVNSDGLPVRFSFLDPRHLVEKWDFSRHHLLPAQGGLIILDTSDEFNLGIMAEEALPQARGIFMVDHHEPSPLTKLPGHIDTDAASTSEIIYALAVSYGMPIDEEAAAAAFTGLVYDTGSFIYPKTSASTFRTALALVEAGAVPHRVHRNLYENAPLSALLLQKRVLSSLEILSAGSVSVLTLTRRDLEETGASYEDSENFINIPLQCRDIVVSVFLKENEDGRLRCSLRSKGTVNVSKIAQGFGGGGHRTAAGFKGRAGLAETKAEVLQRVISALDQA